MSTVALVPKQRQESSFTALQIAANLLSLHWQSATAEDTTGKYPIIRAPIDTEKKENISIALLNVLGFSSAAGYKSNTLGRTVRLYRDESLLFEAFLRLCKSASNYHNLTGPRPNVFAVPSASLTTQTGSRCIYFDTRNLPDYKRTALVSELREIQICANDKLSGFFSNNSAATQVASVGDASEAQYWRLNTLLHAAAWRLALHLGPPDKGTQGVVTFPDIPASFGPPEQNLLTMFFNSCEVSDFTFINFGNRLALKIGEQSINSAYKMHMNINLPTKDSVLNLDYS